jgi:hypothetical protein
MSQPLAIDPEDLARNSDQLNQLGQKLQEDSATYRNIINGLGNYAGDDDYGKLFHSVIDPQHQQIFSIGHEVGAGAKMKGADIEDSAAAYTGVNQFNGESIPSVSDIPHLP